MSDSTDNELMERYVRGDAEAFDELFGRYEQRAFGYFMRRTRSEDLAGDLYQELFLRLHRFRGRYDPSRPFAPWFFQIARRVLVDEYRRPARDRETPLDCETFASPGPDVETRMARRQEALELLGRLPAEQARTLVAAKVEGFEYAEIADRVNKSVDAVKQAASRTLRRLRLAERPAA
jgi:RNA polymerase sigma-70 factor (ECF subfamily)